MGKDLKGKELGKGLYQRKDGRYEAKAQVNGIKINLYDLSLAKLKKDFNEAKALANQNMNTKKINYTLDDWFYEWFDTYKTPNMKSTSAKSMKNKYKGSFGCRIGEKKISDIINKDIQDVINDMKDCGRADSSTREALGTIQKCFESARHNRIIQENPCFEVIVTWKAKDVKRRYLSKEEQVIFLRQASENWYIEMFYVMLLTGLRIGEVGGLKWCDIDFKNKCINVNQALTCDYDEGVKTMYLGSLKTPNSYRKIPFMGEIEEKLLAQRKKQIELKKKLGKRWRSNDEFSDLVFTSTMGSQVTRYIGEKEINKIVTAINQAEAFHACQENRLPVIYEKCYPHAFRHTFCSMCFEYGLEPKVVQALMGHAHYSTTMDIYTQVTKDKFELEVSKFQGIGTIYESVDSHDETENLKIS